MSSARRYSTIRIYSPRKYVNPFFQRRRSRVRRLSLKIKLIILGCGCLIVAVGWALLFNRYFMVDNVIVNGSQKIAEDKIYDIIAKRLSARRLFIFSQQNIFAFSKRQAKREILNNFFVADLTINKKLPRTITVSFNESAPVAVWAEGERYYYIDSNMIILSPVESLELSADNLIILKNALAESQIKTEDTTKKVAVGERYLNICLNLRQKLVEKQIAIDNICEVNKAEVKVQIKVSAGGPKIYFSADDTLDKQFAKLTVLLAGKISPDALSKLEYIDLRFGDKVYYK
ncbi:hypothetical protein COU01_04065 [Candidatus Falkowbacteria bacterium CG10_big_fil_rev_8_21_14_0_10_44_15]|uniref:POTRA domain-containing protein n=1 Tax=Candidatus Falkowbacteria bacterium CG10_big_fil_rev_8_21_14_0_10_44_15 TaxID=1974569 RepID=A0A2H0UYU9_9BACT|nr:MAG: hypothetical protein COU01_04065 [Candidatus Falkowbacteria bacterium CG10_big_fil_rev_8_21_14_0_10_44_15]